MDRRIALVAEPQLGLVTHAQSITAGLTEEGIRYRIEVGRWRRAHAGVYVVAGAPWSWEQDVMAACLAAGPGAVASHRSAAVIWGLDGVASDVVEVSVPRPRCHRLRGVIVHRSTDLDRSTAMTRAGILVSSPVRTLVDLGAVVPARTVERALDQAVSRRLVSLAGVRRELEAVARKGRRGAGVLRDLLDERADAYTLIDSVLEAHMLRRCRNHGVALPICQYEVREGNRFVGRVDFAFPHLRLAIEVDGYESHAGLAAFRHDRVRQNDLVAAGWTVLRFTWHDVTANPERVAASITRLLGALVRVEHG